MSTQLVKYILFSII